jgi:CRISPR type III-A-associated protein Csm2
LRRVFNKARGIEAKLKSQKSGGQTTNIKMIEPDIYTLKRTVAYQVGRGREQKLVTDSFKEFIDRNVALAVQGERNFQAFLQHFEAVLAYFVYYSGEWANKRMGE